VTGWVFNKNAHCLLQIFLSFILTLNYCLLLNVSDLCVRQPSLDCTALLHYLHLEFTVSLSYVIYALQVCALQWSTNYKEFISGHGYANNELVIWKYPSMTKVYNLNFSPLSTRFSLSCLELTHFMFLQGLQIMRKNRPMKRFPIEQILCEGHEEMAEVLSQVLKADV
jgi:hypothetical protein